MSVRIIIITAHDAMCTMRSKEKLSEIIKIHQVLARNRLSLSLSCVHAECGDAAPSFDGDLSTRSPELFKPTRART